MNWKILQKMEIAVFFRLLHFYVSLMGSMSHIVIVITEEEQSFN